VKDRPEECKPVEDSTSDSTSDSTFDSTSDSTFDSSSDTSSDSISDTGSDSISDSTSESAADSIAAFCHKAPRKTAESASILLTISVKPNEVERLKKIFAVDGEIWSHRSLWLRITLKSVSLKSQNRIYYYILGQRKGEDVLKMRLKYV
jgi:hypothetical protein